MRNLLRYLPLLSFLVLVSDAFVPARVPFTTRTSSLAPRTLSSPAKIPAYTTSTFALQASRKPRFGSSVWKRIQKRFDVLESAGLSSDQVRLSGLFRRIKQLHNPITYLVVALLAGLKWDWCFRNPYYWFGVAFCVKWYRARYVFKIPVWDRQPNWNNIITSKEQEKDLKAFTCKNCGSTIFIAKSREFFFEGDTGIGGLGCFACGAKGKDNFVMDRDRIVEDVADVDDYFEYERPLDFVSRAERRKLLKEAQGDEEKANQLLLERANAEAGQEGSSATGETDGDQQPTSDDTVASEEPTTTEDDSESEPTPEPEAVVEPEVVDVEVIEESPEPEPAPEEPKAETSPVSELYQAPPPPKKADVPSPPAKTEVTDDDLDLLDMDSF